MSELITPKLKVPFQMVTSGTKAAVIEQDSTDEILQCVRAILKTEIGSQIDEPEMGVPDFAFRTDMLSDDILNALEEWEPRAVVNLTETEIEDALKSVWLATRARE